MQARLARLPGADLSDTDPKDLSAEGSVNRDHLNQEIQCQVCVWRTTKAWMNASSVLTRSDITMRQ